MQTSLISYLFFSILLATGLCLKCEFCSSNTASCNGLPQVCAQSEKACLILTTETVVDNVSRMATYKGCTKTTFCRPSPMSFTFPSKRKRSASKCCHKNLCNNGAVTLPKLGIKPNGLKCPGCISQDSRCIPTEILHCNGWEDNCVYYDVSVEKDGQVYTHVERGCGTKFTCINEPRIFGVPGIFMEVWKAAECTPAPKIFTKVECSCEGPSCNNEKTVKCTKEEENTCISVVNQHKLGAGRECPQCYVSGHRNCEANGTVLCRGDMLNCTTVTGVVIEGNHTIPFAGKGCATPSVCSLAERTAPAMVPSGLFTIQLDKVTWNSAPAGRTLGGYNLGSQVVFFFRCLLSILTVKTVSA